MDWSGIDIPVGGDVAVVALDADGGLGPDSDNLDALLAAPTQAAWDALRPVLARRLRDELGRGDLIAHGITLYDLDVRLGTNVERTVRRTPSGDVVVTGVTGVHTIIATSTTPTDLGSWADPRFSVDFGLVFEYVLDLPPVTGPVSVSGLRLVRLTGIHPDSQNLVADVALFFVRIAEFFAGGPLLDRLLQWVEEQNWAGSLEDAFGPQLNLLNARLESLAARGYHFLDALVGDADDLARQLESAGGAARAVLDAIPVGTQQLLLVCRAPDTSGVVEGEISWPESQGVPMSPAELAMFRRLTATYLGTNVQAQAVRAMAGGPVASERVRPVSGHRLSVRLGRADVTPGDVAELSAAPSAARMLVAALGERPTFNLLAGGPPDAETVVLDGPSAPVVVDTVADFRARLGGGDAYALVTDRFRRGPLQFDVTCIADIRGARQSVGRLTTMWSDDGDGWCRRRFRLEDVWTDTPLDLDCRLAAGWGWSGRVVEEVTRRNWDGQVTVHRARPIAELVRDGMLQVTVHQADGQRRTVAVAALEAAGVVAASPTDRAVLVRSGMVGDEVALNPQPLPPKEGGGFRRVGQRFEEQAIIIVGGRARGEAVPTEMVRSMDLGGAVQRFALKDRARAGHAGVGDGIVEGLRVNVERIEGVEVAAGRAVDAAGHQVEGAVREATVVDLVADRFGDLDFPRMLDPDLFIPDVDDPHGWGTVRGIDFRVHLRA